MADVDFVIEIVRTGAVVLSEGAKEGTKETIKKSIEDVVRSVFLSALLPTIGSSMIGAGVIALSKMLICQLRKIAEKAPNNDICDRLRYAEMVLSDYGDLLDDGQASRDTRDSLLRVAISKIYEAMVLVERLEDGRYVKRARLLNGFCGLMLGDVHTRMKYLDPFIEEAVEVRTQFEMENLEGAEIYAQLSDVEMTRVHKLIEHPAVKNVFAAFSPLHFHCRKATAAWTGQGADPLAKVMNQSGPKASETEKMVIFLVLKAYRDARLKEFDIFLTGCETRTIHRSLRPMFGKKRGPKLI